jgi:2',3'-cyclic-nucleotide 2'-phosphodiesterase (5'-nucleotidase family)
MHTGYIRGNFVPIDKRGTPCPLSILVDANDTNDIGCIGGMYHLAARIESIRSSSPGTILIDCGNAIQGNNLLIHFLTF